MADAPPATALESPSEPPKVVESEKELAPAAKSKNAPPAKPAIFARLPLELRSYTSQADRTILRLNKLLTTTAGLDSLLATLNYTFYLLAYLETRLLSQNRLLDLLYILLARRPLSKASITKTPPAPSLTSGSSNTLLATLISDLRTTLRLTALLPLYNQLRLLLSPSQTPTDPALYLIALTQCILYIGYQALENLAHLTDHAIPLLPIPKSFLGGPGSAKTWLLSNRLWFLGVTCDFARLARQAQLEYQGRQASSVGKRKMNRSVEEQRAVERRWWNELVVAGCWWPLCLHWSLEGGLWGVNDGVIGVLGVVAGLETFRGMWKETEAS